MSNAKKRICFIHPDLGLGGAERLIIDAAVGLQNRGHKVTILTSHCDPRHCFDEARDGELTIIEQKLHCKYCIVDTDDAKGTLDVRVRGNAIFPPTLGGRFKIMFSILRQIALVLSVAIFSSELDKLDPDVFVVDQLSACVPLFRLLRPHVRILFYGHFPDRLLVKEEQGSTKLVKAFYRAPFDWLESWSTGCSDAIVVNSKFTRSVFRRTFPSLRSRDLRVVYPCVDTNAFSPTDRPAQLWTDRKLLLSINRYEEKKNLGLAISGYAGLSISEREKVRLVIAGGYDQRVDENITTHQSLQALTDSLNLRHATFKGQDSKVPEMDVDGLDVIFLLSISEDLKRRLLSSASLLIYTPSNEHFGIVPLEAMVASVPVLAANSGGPLETIYDGRTGWTRNPDKPSLWTDVMRKPLIPSSAETLRTMGQRGREHVSKEFSRIKMAEVLEGEVRSLFREDHKRPSIWLLWLFGAIFGAASGLFTIVIGAKLAKGPSH